MARSFVSDFLSQVNLRLIPFDAYMLEKHNTTTQDDADHESTFTESNWDDISTAFAEMIKGSGIVVAGQEPSWSTTDTLKVIFIEMMNDPSTIFDILDKLMGYLGIKVINILQPSSSSPAHSPTTDPSPKQCEATYSCQYDVKID